ncbi:MAG: OmpA family protein [Rickettsiales bacterium]|nr:OmpA family protein [Rickettsiales bacterium]
MYKKFIYLFLVLTIASCSAVKKNSSVANSKEETKAVIKKESEEQNPKMYSVSEDEIKKSGTKPYVVYFDTDSAKLTSKSVETLTDKVLPDAIDKNAKKVVIEAHCDERGSKAYNKKLSNRRANAVKDYLVKNGVKVKIKTVGYGESKPVALGHDEDSWSQNRRAITITIKK